MAHSLKRGVIISEFALMIPVILLFTLCLVQYALIIKTNWALDQAAGNACRAALVNPQNRPHPDPLVAAQLTMIPVASPLALRGHELPTSNNKVLNWGSRYLGAIARTEIEVDNNAGHAVYCKVTHAMQLDVPIAGEVFGKSANVLGQLKEFTIHKVFNEGDARHLADYWSVITGKPHILLTREVNIFQ